MATPPFPHHRRHTLTLLPFLLLLPLLAAADRVLEDSYAVTTAADLNHLPASAGPASGLHPYALVPRPRAGDLVVLDSAGSALYTLLLCFTTTIAGGLASGHGHRDGPAQNATFSPDFELVYVPRICALLVTDRGNRLIRRVNLTPEDCAYETHSGLGATSVSIIAVLCALLGSVIGFLARHFYPLHEISINRFFSRIQKKYKRTQRKATLISFCDIRSAVANSMFYALLLKVVRVSIGYLTVVFPTVRLERRVPHKRSRLAKLDKTVAAPSTGLLNKALVPTELLGDLISFGGDTGDGEKEHNGITCGGSVNKAPCFDGDLMELLYTPQDSHKIIDHMIEANLSDFSSQEECHGLTVSRRRLHGDSKVI